MVLGRDLKDELIILRSGSSATGDNSFINLVGTGSNRHVVGLDAVISLFSFERNTWSRGGGSVSSTLYTYPRLVSVSPGCFQRSSPLPQLGLLLYLSSNSKHAATTNRK